MAATEALGNDGMPTVYFDTNAFTALWLHPGLEERARLRLRRRMVSTAFQRRPRVVMGPKLVAELAPMVLANAIPGLLDFFRQLPDLLILNRTMDVIREEARAAIAGETDANIFLSDDQRHSLLNRDLRLSEAWQEEVALLARQRREFAEKERRLKTEIVTLAGKRSTLAHMNRGWFGDPIAVVRDWCRDTLRVHRKDFNLPDDETLWPDVLQFPTIWAMNSYRLARLYLVNRDGRRIDGNDLPDWGHYMGAIHADEIVSDDRRFCEIMRECPSPKPTARAFIDWAREILNSNSG